MRASATSLEAEGVGGTPIAIPQARKRSGRHGALAFAAILITGSLFLSGCSTPARLPPEPGERVTDAVVLNTPYIRYFPDTQAVPIFDEGVRALQREMKYRGVTDPKKLPVANYLAVSGGGEDGAFGAGLLLGWTESGKRPEFKLVTGVSTGALIAPFAFLGPAYDQQLKDVFTRMSAKDIYQERGMLFSVLYDDALNDTAPLFRTISRYVNDDMLAAIAREYDKGRLLFIGTTNLDANRPVIWNIGAIAASKQPGALELVRKILLASAAVPAAFPPVMIDVSVDGKEYQEMHVDGGAVAQLFLYPPEVGRMIAAEKTGRTRRAFIIRNSLLGVPWSDVNRRTLDIATKAISTMIYVSGVNDLYRLYFVTQADKVDYNLAYIGTDFAAPQKKGDFDPTYMRALYEYAYQKARAGYPWNKRPPYLQGQ
jgi:hypothetical protein